MAGLLLVSLLAALPDAGVVTEPPQVQCPSVPYPAAERASGIKGQVVLRLSLGADGAIAERAVVSSIGPAFAAQALAALPGCRITPARVGGAPVASTVELTLGFEPPVLPWVLEGEVVGELGQSVAGAAVSLGEVSTQTDELGHFRLVLLAIPGGDPWVVVEKEGYALKGFPELFRPGETTRVRYALSRQRGFETRVSGSRFLPPVPDADRTPTVSHFSLSASDIQRTPGALEDIARVVQQLPGVAADPDLLASFFVRGGAPEETLMYIDGVPLSNPYHLGGFASIFNPMMIDGAELYAGGAPARYEPALSGVLDVRYATGEARRFRAQADVSIQTAKVRVDVPLGVEGLGVVAAFRRSYFELYAELLKALGVLGSSVVAPDITEGLARLSFKRGVHHTTLTFIHASDGFDLRVKPGEEVLVNFAGGLKLLNSAQIVSLRHVVDLAGDSAVEAQVAYSRDANLVNVDSQQRFGSDALRNEVLARVDGVWAPSAAHRTSLGAQYAWRQLTLTGDVTDARAVAPWARQPIVDAGRGQIPINPSLSRHLVALYAEHVLRPVEALALEASGRVQYDASGRQWSGSGRAAAALTLPSLSVLKLSAGVAWQPVQLPLALDPTFGNPRLGPERAINLVVGLEQPLPFEALVRVEGWAKWLSALVVNPDTPQALQRRLANGLSAYAGDGTGWASGADLALVGRTRAFSYNASVGVLFAERTNPLAEGARTYPVQWAQRLTLGAGVSWTPSSQWLVTARVNFRSGRPYTPVLGFTRDDGAGRYLPVFGETSGETYPFFFEVSLRGDHRFPCGPLSCTVYAELLNVTNTMNVFSWIYGAGDFDSSVPPGRGAFTHLPIRPFLGIRAEY